MAHFMLQRVSDSEGPMQLKKNAHYR